MQIDIEGLKRNRIMARARGNYELYLLVRQMVNELNQGIKRFAQVTQNMTGDYIIGTLNCQKNERIESYSRLFVKEPGKRGLVIHLIRINNIK